MNRNRLTAVLVAAAGLALPASAHAAGYQDAVLASDPLTYLRLDEPLGSIVAQDASLNDRDGAYSAGVTLGVAAPFLDAGTAPALGTNGTVTAGVGQVSRTLELWVNPNRLARGQQAGIVAHGNPATDGWSIGLGPKRKLAIVTGGATVQSKVTLSSNVWTMVTVTWSDKVRVYLNGALKKAYNGGPATGSGAFVLGGNGAGAFTGSFAGKLDEAALYSAALSAAQVQAHFIAAHVPGNTAPPTIGGTLSVGSTLTASPGSWSDAVGATRAYQWQRCDANGDDCGDIDLATGTAYLLTAADACTTLQVAETVTNASGAGTAISDFTGQVLPCLPANSALPTIGGTAVVDGTLTAGPGTWSDAGGATRSYQWQRCDPDGSGCADIGGETGTTFVVGAADECMTLRVTETVTNASGPASATSAPTAQAVPCLPANTAVPTVSGTAVAGQTLTANPGTWSEAAGATRDYQWQRCAADGSGCADIGGETGTTFVLSAADECMTLRVVETVTNASGPAGASSDATAQVVPCLPVNSALPMVSGTADAGATLTADPGTWSEAAGATRSYKWRRCDADGSGCADIGGATDTTYALTGADDCMTLRVVETVTNASGPASATSDPTGKVGPCTPPDADPDPKPDPTPDADPDPTPTPQTTTAAPRPQSKPARARPSELGQSSSAAGCLRLVAGRKRLKLRGYGVLRLKATKNICLTAPIAAKLKVRKGTALKSVRYTLDGKRLKRVKKLKFGAKLRPAKLTAGNHVVKLRVTPKVGKAKTFKLRLRLAVA